MSKGVQTEPDHSSNQYRWITQPSRDIFVSKERNARVGPGSYDIIPKVRHNFHENHHSLFNTWGKTAYLPPLVKPTVAKSPGPGAYQPIPIWKAPHDKPKNQQRRHFIFQNHKKVSQGKIFRDFPTDLKKGVPSVQPEQEDEVLPSPPQAAFASKVTRFPEDPQNNVKTGPGCYDHVPSKVVRNLPRIVYLRSSTKIPPKMSTSIGPTTYDLKGELANQVEKKGYAVSRETRFHYRHKVKTEPNNSTPGPGHYQSQIEAKQRMLRLQQLSQKKSKLIHYNSAHRAGLRVQKQAEGGPPVAYDVQIFDLEYRMRKKMEHKERLKLMQIEQVGFESRSKRL